MSEFLQSQAPESTAETVYPIRAMSAADLKEVLRVERASYQLPWTEQIFKDCLKVGYHSLVLEEEGGLSGFVIFSCAVGEAHILNLCIDPKRRRSGFAEALLAQAVSVVIVAGARVMFLEVRESNKGAIALYEKSGFVETGRRENYYNTVPKEGKKTSSKREDALVMARDLTF
ncbi:ribosomal-protein-alanine N-acetyltransferase [Chromatiales bacterium (ex Bugula neritina AB1)]|nr:ribosomal-protein-alanine N-acetyltransferase [Chromatiales bacterium (ex Bugula neritina AB1)]